MGAVIRCDPRDGEWQVLGAERYRGVVPEGIEATANDWGPDQLSFNVKVVEPAALRPDLLPYTPLELEIDGMLVWAGRIKQRPSTQQDHSISAEGWQYHLDDDAFARIYVHTRVSDYRDLRTFLGADLTRCRTEAQVSNDSGIVAIGWADGGKVATNDVVGVMLDLGPDSTCKRLVLEWDKSVTDSAIDLYGRGSDSENPLAGTPADYFTFTPQSTAAGFAAGSVVTARRYVSLFLLYKGSGGTFTADQVVRLKSIRAFRDTAYESGNASVLKADSVIKDALPFAPLLNQATDQIAAGTFSIPEHLFDYRPPRNSMEAVNAFENYQLYVGGPDLKTLGYRAKVTTPSFVVGEWSGSEFADASVAGEDIYDKVIVTGTGPDGAPLVSTRTQTGTLVDRNGFHRTKVLPISTAGTQAVYDRIGDLWLADHKLSPFAGKLQATNGIRRWQGGASVPAHELLTKGGERIHLSHRIDPDTGALGRDGVIDGVRYSHDNRSVEIDIDDRRDHFESVLERYGILVDQFLH